MQRLLGLDLRGSTIRAALGESSLWGFRLVGLYAAPRHPHLEAGAQLKAFLAEHHLSADTVISCLPGDVLSHRMLSLPFHRPHQLQEIVPLELETYLPFKLEEVVVDFCIVERHPPSTSILALFTPKDLLQQHLTTLAEAGLDPRRVEASPLALLRTLFATPVELTGSWALVDLGSHSTTILLLHEGRLRGLHTLSMGVENSEGLSAYIREIRWTLLALDQENSSFPPRLILSGEGASQPALQAELERELGPATSLNAISLRGVPQSWQKEQEAFACALGLILPAQERRPDWRVNLCREKLASHPQTSPLQREAWRLGLWAALAGFLALLGSLADYYRLKAYDQALKGEIRRLFTSTLPEVQTVIDEKIQLEQALSRLRRSSPFLHTPAGSFPSPLECLRLLSQSLPTELKLDIEELSLDGEALRLRGSTDSFEAAETIKKTTSTLFPASKVQLKDVQTAPDGGKVEFRLIVSLRSPNI